MSSQSLSDRFAVVVVVVLLMLTALGNALAMFVVAIVLLVRTFSSSESSINRSNTNSLRF